MKARDQATSQNLAGTTEVRLHDFDHLLKPVAPRAPKRMIEPLTDRETEVLTMVCDGASNHEIARCLGISVPTVKWHLLHVFAKLGVERRTQAVVIAIYLGIVEPAWLSQVFSSMN